MDILEDILASFLIDVIKAQNRANKFSASLVPEYRDPTIASPPENPNLGYFPIPNSVIRSFDFRLTFALEDQGDDTRDEILASAARRADAAPASPTDPAATPGLPIKFNLDLLKEADERILATVNFQVDMRSYQLGFTTGPTPEVPGQHRLILTG